MARLCERPGCSEPGAIAYGFDPDRLLVWLMPLDPTADRNRAGVLCLRHADAMVVPIGWSLDDARDPMPRLFQAPRQPSKRPRRRPTNRADGAGPEQLSLVDPASDARDRPPAERPGPVPPNRPISDRTVAEVTGIAAAAEVDPDVTTAVPWRPDFDESDDLGGVLDAQSPLLARAFRRSARRH